MAKSVRSKSRRRNLRRQREKCQARVIQQLKKTLGLTKEKEKIRKEEIMNDLYEINSGIAASEKKNKENQDVEMSTDSGGSETKDTPALKNGQNPIWKSQRKIKAAKKAKKRSKTKKDKKVGKKKQIKSKN